MAEPKWANIECVESVVHGTNGVRAECTLIGSTAARPLALFFTAERRTNMGYLGRGALRAFPARICRRFFLVLEPLGANLDSMTEHRGAHRGPRRTIKAGSALSVSRS